MFRSSSQRTHSGNRDFLVQLKYIKICIPVDGLVNSNIFPLFFVEKKEDLQKKKTIGLRRWKTHPYLLALDGDVLCKVKSGSYECISLFVLSFLNVEDNARLVDYWLCILSFFFSLFWLSIPSFVNRRSIISNPCCSAIIYVKYKTFRHRFVHL